MHRVFTVTAGVLALGPVPAQAAQEGCAVQVITPSASWIIRGFDPLTHSENSGAYEVIFLNVGDSECNFTPIFSSDQEPLGLQSTAGARVPYSLVASQEGYDLTPIAGKTVQQGTREEISIAPGGQTTLQVRFEFNPGALTGDGLFSQRLNLDAVEHDGMSVGGRDIIVGVDVLPSAEISLAGAFQSVNGQATVDLGELRSGLANIPLALQIRSTRSYRLTVESKNRGSLRLGETDWLIPYEVLVGGQRVDTLGGEGKLHEGEIGLLREALPLSFYVEDVAARRAGTYSDVLSVTIAPE